MKKNYYRYDIYCLIFLIVSACLCEYYEAFTIIEDQTLSFRQLMRTSVRKIKKVQTRKVVLVSLDDEFYQDLNQKPAKRSEIATLIQKIHALNPKLIVINLLMRYPTYSSEDEILQELLDKPEYSNVLLASHVEFNKDHLKSELIYPSDTIRTDHTTTGYVNIISPCSVVTFLSRLRIYPEIANDSSIKDGWPLAIQAAKKFLNVTPRIQENTLYLGNQLFQLDHNNDLYIDYSPVPADATFLNDYMGLTASAFLKLKDPKPYQYDEEFIKNADYNTLSEEDITFLELSFWVKDRIVVIGDTSIDTRDWYDTPVGTMYGSEVVADAIDTLIKDSFLRPASLPVEWCISIVMLSLILLSVGRIHKVRSCFLVYLGINILFTAVCSILYIYYGYIITMTYNYLAGGLIFFAATLYYRSIDHQKKEFSKKELEKKKASLEQAESKYRSIFENAIEGMFQMDESGHILSANPSALSILGYDHPSEMQDILLDRTNRLYVDRNEQAKLICLIQKETIVKGFETRVYRKDGSWIWLHLSVRHVMDEKNSLAFYEGSFLDITEKKKRIDVERETEAARAAMKSRSEVLASMSHELRTPLNAILGMAKILKESDLSDVQKNYVEIFATAGEHLLVLINDVLSLTKLESGTIQLDLSP